MIGEFEFVFYEYPVTCLIESTIGALPQTLNPFLSSCPTSLAGGDTKKDSKKVKAASASLEKRSLDG